MGLCMSTKQLNNGPKVSNLTVADVTEATSKSSEIQINVELALANATAKDMREGVSRKGFLIKRSKFKHQWKRRHVAYRPPYLYSSHSPTDKPTGVVVIDLDTLVLDAEDSRLDENMMKVVAERQNVFIVRDRFGEQWPLCHDTVSESEAWKALLTQAVKDAQLKREYRTVLLPLVLRGSEFQKKNFNAFPGFFASVERRFVNVSVDCKAVLWHKPGQGDFDQVLVSDIQLVVVGADTNVFRRVPKKKLNEDLCFSIVTGSRTLDLIASSKKQRDAWVKGLQCVLKFGHIVTDEELQELENRKRVQHAKDWARKRVEARQHNQARQQLSEVIQQQHSPLNSGQ